jgi:hypothetical protein
VENAVTIPVEAVVLQGRQPVVYVIDGSNHVHLRAVQVGLEGSKLAEIRSGLSAGERVIAGGQDKYQEGEAISPVMAGAPASENQQQTGGMIDLKADEQTDAAPNGANARKSEARETNGGTR